MSRAVLALAVVSSIGCNSLLGIHVLPAEDEAGTTTSQDAGIDARADASSGAKDAAPDRPSDPFADCGTDTSCAPDASDGIAPQVDGPCSQSGAVACAGASQRFVLACQGGKWTIVETCASGNLCSRAHAMCAPIVLQCADKAPGFAFCDGDIRRVCGPDLVTTDDEKCAASCAAETGTCSGAACGDKKVQAGEACDLGPDNSAGAYGPNQCTTLCQVAPRCGDGKVDDTHGETCDDGKNDGTPGSCGADCKTYVPLPSCGDAIMQPPEQCDTGASNGTPASSCDARCKLKCGNGMLDTGEQCDDGSSNNTGAYGKCASDCKLGPRCGDGTVQSASEQCDDGANNGSATSRCDARCRFKCGNGTIDTGEQCDDGTLSGIYGGCNANCTKAAFCGDGTKNGPEQCDLGTAANTGAYGGCNANCTLAPHCGDAHTDSPQETCDDGNGSNTDSCLTTCRAATCGDGFVFAVSSGGQEECDNGSANSNAGACLATCKRATCGDGFLQTGVEECEDGNTTNGDGCDGCRFGCVSTDSTRNCAQGNPCLQSTCGSDHRCSTPAATKEGMACTSGTTSGFCRSGACQPASCGNGLLEPGEECDDRNTVNGDGCDGCRLSCLGTDPTRNCVPANPCLQSACGSDHRCTAPANGHEGGACTFGGVSGFCRAGTCQAARCGNGFIEPGEQCDDSNQINTDACVGCMSARCGDGFIRAGTEECDDLTAGCLSCRFVCVATDATRNCSDRNTSCLQGVCGSAHTCATQAINEGQVCGAGTVCRSGSCVAGCVTGSHLCGAACFSDADAAHCGPSCILCPNVPNQVGSCVANRCSSACAAGIAPITCPAGGGPSICGAWGFDSQSLDGWRINPDLSDQILTTTVSNARTLDATSIFSFVQSVAVDGINTQEIVLEVPVCVPPGTSGAGPFTTTAIRGIFQVNAFFERASGTPLTGDPNAARVSTAIFDSNVAAGTATVLFLGPNLVEGNWLTGTVSLNGTGTHIQLIFQFFQPWTGKVYLDSLRLFSQ
jgi:cysteine-rich repeat protein